MIIINKLIIKSDSIPLCLVFPQFWSGVSQCLFNATSDLSNKILKGRGEVNVRFKVFNYKKSYNQEFCALYVYYY